MIRSSVRFLSLAIVGAGLAGTGAAAHAQRAQVSPAEYDRAVKMLGQNVNPLVIGGTVQATWLPDGRFWYRGTTAAGTTVYLVDGAKKTRTPLDNTKLATALSAASGSTVAPGALALTTLTVADDAKSVSIDVGSKRFSCVLDESRCTASGDRKSTRLNSSHIPLSRMPSSA